MNKKIGIIGLGTVGLATLKSLKLSSSLIKKRTGIKIEVKKACDLSASARRKASKLGVSTTKEAYDIINDPDIDIVVELIGGINPAKTFIKKALKNKKNVVTANKALLSEFGSELFPMAEKSNVNIGFEASVCGAIPLIRSVSQGLVGCKVKSIYGILNGTCNYILDQMSRKKVSFAEALKDAQIKGFAEAKPKFDIEGIDTLHKLSILSYLCFGAWPNLKKVHVEGVTKIEALDIFYANELDFAIKLLAVAKEDKSGLDLRVHPTLVPKDHPLAQVSSAFNAVWIDSHPAGKLFFHGAGAGGDATSSAVVSDIVNVCLVDSRLVQEHKRIKFTNIDDLMRRYYIRFMALDKPGVLAKVSKILASYNISIASVKQKKREKSKAVPIVMVTHEAKESSMKKALEKIEKASVIYGSSQLIRIEDL